MVGRAPLSNALPWKDFSPPYPPKGGKSRPQINHHTHALYSRAPIPLVPARSARVGAIYGSASRLLPARCGGLLRKAVHHGRAGSRSEGRSAWCGAVGFGRSWVSSSWGWLPWLLLWVSVVRGFCRRSFVRWFLRSFVRSFRGVAGFRLAVRRGPMPSSAPLRCRWGRGLWSFGLPRFGGLGLPLWLCVLPPVFASVRLRGRVLASWSSSLPPARWGCVLPFPGFRASALAPGLRRLWLPGWGFRWWSSRSFRAVGRGRGLGFRRRGVGGSRLPLPVAGRVAFGSSPGGSGCLACPSALVAPLGLVAPSPGASFVLPSPALVAPCPGLLSRLGLAGAGSVGLGVGLSPGPPQLIARVSPLSPLWSSLRAARCAHCAAPRATNHHITET